MDAVDTFETGAGPVHEMKRASLKRRVTVDVEGFPIMIAVHEASLQDRNGAPDVIFGIAEKAPQVTKLWADGGYAGPSWGTRWPDTASVPEIVPGPKEARKQGSKGLRRRLPPLDGGTDICLDVPVPASGEALGAGLGDFTGLGPAGRCRFLMRGVAQEITP